MSAIAIQTSPARRPPIRRHMLAVLSALVVGVVVAFVMAVYVIERQTREDDFVDVVKSVETLLRQKFATASGLMHATVEALTTSEEIGRAFDAKDVTALERAIRPLFETLGRDHRITHLYFTGPDRVNLLRLHDPDNRGDTIDRFTMRRAAETAATFSGIELGPLGTLTLRSVTPWRRDGRIIGYIELGEEIGPLLADTATSLGVHLYALAKREYLDRAAWERGRRMMGRSTGPLEFGDHLLVSQSEKDLEPAELELLTALTHDGSMRTSSTEGRTLAVTALPLLDAAGRDIGRLAIFADRSRAQATVTNWVVLATLFSLIAGALVFLSFNRALAGVERDYRRQHELEHRLLRISNEHERLVQIEKLSAVGTMIGEIAHQLNNPLVGVINMAQLAERSADRPERVRELLAEIRKAGQNCSAFVKRMLNFTKVSCFDSRPSDLGPIIDDALALFHQSIGRRVAVERCLPDEPVRLAVDPNLLGHALFNLLTNAAQAVGPGGHVRLTLEPAVHADGRAGWCLAVDDDGPGFSEEVARKLFTPFFTTRKDGTGLGLAVVMHIVLLHEGEVEASNRPDGGARLAVWLPAADPNPARTR